MTSTRNPTEEELCLTRAMWLVMVMVDAADTTETGVVCVWYV